MIQNSRSLLVSQIVAGDAVNLKEALLFHLRDFRITLKRYKIEVLFGDLPIVYADDERVSRFFRTAIGRIVQFSRDSQPVVCIDAVPLESGIDLVITARKENQEYLLVVGHFTGISFERA